MKYRIKKLLSLLVSVSLVAGNITISAADFSSETDAVIFSPESAAESESDSIILSDEPDASPEQEETPELIISPPEEEALPEGTPEFTEIPSSNTADIPDKDFTDGEVAPKNELFSSGETESTAADYILGRPMTEQEIQQQLALMGDPEAFAPSENPDSQLDIDMYGFSDPCYDAREDGLVTSVKSQNPFNICWAFSLVSNFETSLLKQGAGNNDLSEEHLAYFFANRVKDPLGNTPDDRILHLKKDYHDGGNGMVASFFLSTWSGMVNESKAPLPTDSTHTSDLSVPLADSLAYDTDAYMRDAVFSAYSEDRMKLLISEYGSVSAMILMDNTGTYYRAETAASSCPSSGRVNHAVTVIGWDDTYSKENFSAASGVKNDGAWIVKNSYGTSWGKNGYFYLSYEDASITNLVCNTAVSSPAYPNNYFYDGASTGTVSVRFPSGYSIANVFTANAGNGNAEELGEIVVASKQDFTEYLIQVYTDLKNPLDPTSGTPAFAAPISYTQPLAGISTISLDTPVTLTQGSRYSVVLTFLGEETRYYVESTTSAESGSWFQAIAGLKTGQSFSSPDRTKWTDCAALSTGGYCFSIKAHTRTLDRPVEIPSTVPATPKPTAAPKPTATPKPRTFHVTYKSNTRLKTGNMPSDRTNYTSGKTVKVRNAPYCTSRFFLGWNTRSDGKGTYYYPGRTFKITGNITLYAQWKTTCTSSSRLIYRVNGKQTVSCCGTSNSNIRKVTIPSTIKYHGITYKVTSVKSNAFRDKKRLSSVSVGNQVSVIGSRAFYNCRSLNRVTTGTGLKQIDSYAFGRVKRGCILTIRSTRLKKVTSQIDYRSPKMTVKVPKKKYSYYRRLFRARSKTVSVKKY